MSELPVSGEGIEIEYFYRVERRMSPEDGWRKIAAYRTTDDSETSTAARSATRRAENARETGRRESPPDTRPVRIVKVVHIEADTETVWTPGAGSGA